jgi:uncharacterized membrane protein YhfC
MVRYLQVAFAVVAWIFVATIVIQVFLIGLGLFDDPKFQETHRDFGYTGVGLAAIHPVLAMGIFVLALQVARTATALARAPIAEPG